MKISAKTILLNGLWYCFLLAPFVFGITRCISKGDSKTPLHSTARQDSIYRIILEGIKWEQEHTMEITCDSDSLYHTTTICDKYLQV